MSTEPDDMQATISLKEYLDLKSRLAEAEERLPCGHPKALRISSLESDYAFCELCECKSERNDAITMEASQQAELATLQSAHDKALADLTASELLCESKAATCASLLAKLKAANADTKRINWLNANGWAQLLGHGTLRFQADIRPAIDARYTRISESGRSLGDELDTLEENTELQAAHDKALADLARCRGMRDAAYKRCDEALAELHAISEALGTNEGHSSVKHVLALRARVRELEGALESALNLARAANAFQGAMVNEEDDDKRVSVWTALTKALDSFYPLVTALAIPQEVVITKAALQAGKPE